MGTFLAPLGVHPPCREVAGFLGLAGWLRRALEAGLASGLWGFGWWLALAGVFLRDFGWISARFLGLGWLWLGFGWILLLAFIYYDFAWIST